MNSPLVYTNSIIQDESPQVANFFSFRKTNYLCFRDHKFLSQVLQLSPQDIKTLVDLDRHSNLPRSNMSTLGLNFVLRENHTYQLIQTGIKEIDDYSEGLDLESPMDLFEKPPVVELFGLWDKTKSESGDLNNILGDNGRLLIGDSQLEVPVIEATDRTLSYYGARLIKQNDVFRFNYDLFPLWITEVGENYVSQFIMSEQGGGMYLEHHDKPHFHMPLSPDCSGFVLLGKQVEEDDLGNGLYHLTGFKIPFGSALYTQGGVVHADACVIGLWLVGFTTTENCSTVVLRNSNNIKEFVSIYGKITKQLLTILCIQNGRAYDKKQM